MFDLDDTIVAISSPAGVSARAIVRLSGPEAVRLAERFFLGAEGPLAEAGGFRAFDGRVVIAGAGEAPNAIHRVWRPLIELPARAYVFRAPRSYTRQDVVELHIPGSPVAATAMVSALLDAGARAAGPGEFTARAFFSGRIDLSAAEAVADMIDAADHAQLRQAGAAMGGWIHKLCRRAAAALTDALATVEASIDLAEEDIVLEQPRELSRRLEGVSRRLRRVARRAAEMPETAARPHVVIAGAPNVGKSSLLNALSGVDRAIVSALAGTTRDVLTAAMHLADGSVAVLQDAAGLTKPAGSLAAAADQAAWAAVVGADVVLFVFDLSAGRFEADIELLRQVRDSNRRCPLLAVGNKVDLLDEKLAARRTAKLAAQLPEAVVDATSPPTLAVSALRGDGLERLRRAIAECLNVSAERPGQLLGLHQRQKRHLLAAAEAVRRTGRLLRPTGHIADVAELAAIELRTALNELGQISGQVITEDVLGRIFSRFCVGK
jgi:tRNA modification GTPase